jgi:hypothetical protein
MDDDPRLNAQLRALGKKLFQFRELVAKMEIPESVPAPPLDTQAWETFVGKCSSAATVLKQVHAALTPDMYHLSVFPGEKVWQNPAAVPDLLSVPPRAAPQPNNPLARSREEVVAWNTKLEQANMSLEALIESSSKDRPSKQKAVSDKQVSHELVQVLFTSTSRERCQG